MATYRGKLEAGKIVLREMPKYPDGTEVEVVLTPISPEPEPFGARKNGSGEGDDPAFHIAERAVPTGIKDLSAEHDHYIYGAPKRDAQK